MSLNIHGPLIPSLSAAFIILFGGHTSSNADSGSSGTSSAPRSGSYLVPAPAAPRAPRPPTPSPALAARIKESHTNVAAATITNAWPATNTLSAADPGKAQALVNIEMLKMAAKGSASAQYKMGLRYLNGSGGVEKNLEKAKMLLELGAIQGHVDAKRELELLIQATATKDRKKAEK